MKKISLILVFVCLIFAGCRTTTTSENNNSDVVQYVTKVEHDTLFERMVDSVYFEVRQKNDTIFQTKYKEVIRWKDRVKIQIDTFYRDSIVVEYKESVKEVIYIPKIYRYSLYITIILVIFAIVKIAIWLKTKSII